MELQLRIPLKSGPILKHHGLTDGSRAFKLPLVSLMKSHASAIQMHLELRGAILWI